MFFEQSPQDERSVYVNLLKTLGSLSNLFSESDVPYLYYRWAEKVFCRAFGATDHSRWDTAIDASKNGIGIGLKTFLEGNGNSFQKVAEFNKESTNFRALVSQPELLVAEIARLRNERLSFAQRTYNVDELVYHCVLRKPWKFIISEERMDFINTEGIRDIVANPTTVHFSDGIHDYNFSITKSTLLKRFRSNPLFEFDVEILDDPFSKLTGGSQWRPQMVDGMPTAELLEYLPKHIVSTVILPLYSERWGMHVPERSGLNQWNAAWRPRQKKEVYIPVPSLIHAKCPWFFPDRDTPFDLKLPNWTVISAKICQDGWKALMSNPNTDLGDWLIDKVLKVPEWQIVTYEMLQGMGIDSVEVSKDIDGNFSINFKKTWSYEQFRSGLDGNNGPSSSEEESEWDES